MNWKRSAIPMGLAIFGMASAACGTEGADSAKAASVATQSQANPGGLEPCKLLTDTEVRTVLPGLKGSVVASRGDR